MRRILFTLGLLLLALPADAQRVQSDRGPGEAIPVRCVNTLGTAFEACGGGGGAGTDVNISGVGGNAVTTSLPTSFIAPQHIIVDSMPAGGAGLTDTELRASAVSVNFTNTTIAVTNAGTFAVQAAQSGTWNIGSVTTLPAITFASPQAVTQSGTWNIGSVTTLPAITFAAPQHVIIDSATLGTVTVSDGAGALNVIVDSATLGTLTVSDGAGAMNTIVDSGTLTAVTSITNAVTVTDGAGALNVIVDSATLGTVTVSDGAGAMNAIIDSGTVTANAGTNLNTSALNLEATQADVRTALQIIDDWDETDRAKVNLIAGQVGVQGGAGPSTALTQRVAIATDANAVSTKTAISYNAPTAASVGVASAQALAANASRKGLVAVNTSNATISCSIGQTAVLNSGITLEPGAIFSMNEYLFATGALNCIAGSAASNLSLQEMQ